MSISLAKLRAAATISAIPKGDSWLVTAHFFGRGSSSASTNKEAAINDAVSDLAATLEALAHAIEGVSE